MDRKGRGYSDIEKGTGKWDAHDLAKRSSYCPIIIFLILSLVLSFVIITKHVIIMISSWRSWHKCFLFINLATNPLAFTQAETIPIAVLVHHQLAISFVPFLLCFSLDSSIDLIFVFFLCCTQPLFDEMSLLLPSFSLRVVYLPSLLTITHRFVSFLFSYLSVLFSFRHSKQQKWPVSGQ